MQVTFSYHIETSTKLSIRRINMPMNAYDGCIRQNLR